MKKGGKVRENMFIILQISLHFDEFFYNKQSEILFDILMRFLLKKTWSKYVPKFHGFFKCGITRFIFL